MRQPAPPGQPAAKKKGTSSCLVTGLVVVAVAVPVVGTTAALAVRGVQKYAGAVTISEAKMTIGAISRAAVAAYERESFDAPHGPIVHRLCASATPVPAQVPRGVKYMPSAAPGADFETGTADAGWKCLKFAVTMPVQYQYHYHAGSGWVVPAHAPGPDGFEAAARGDLNGNGVYSTFARTAKVVDGVVVVSTDLYVDNELE